MRVGKEVAAALFAAGLLLAGGCSRQPEQSSGPAEAAAERSGVPAVDPPPLERAPLPELPWDEFPPDVREQLETAYGEAKASPEDARTVGRLCVLLHAHLLYEPAEACYQRVRALEPEEFRWTYYLGIVVDELGRREEAIALIRRAVELSPAYAPARVRLGDMLRETGELDASEEQYRRAIETDPKLASAQLGLGKLLLARQRWEGAVQAYKRATQLAEDYAPAYYGLGMAYRKLGKTEEARAALRRYQQVKDMKTPVFDPEFEAVAAVLGITEAPESPSLDIPKSGLEKAAAELERALKEQPELLSAHTTLIGLYWELGRPDKAEEHYRAAVRIDPRSPVVHYNWGLLQLLRGNLPEAEKAFRAALKLKPDYDDALVQYGVLLERRGEPERAVAQYRAALKVNPDHRRAHYHLGTMLYARGDRQAALTHFHETVKKQDRETPRFLLLLAFVYADLGDGERALQYLDEARKLAAALEMRDFVAQLDQERRAMVRRFSEQGGANGGGGGI